MIENQVEMPKYKCHKEVHALQIERIVERPNNSIDLFFVDKNFVHMNLEGSEQARFVGIAEPLGYLVVYKDGYKSFSPQTAFEEGYTRIDELG